ncbi:polyprenyl synthetase family protein [Thermoproteota archaeon]
MEKIKNYSKDIEEKLNDELAHYSWSCFYDPMKYALDGGKLVRPLILTLAAASIGTGDEDTSSAAVAVELLHTESIIHDDIIDQEISRRERMAFHVKYGYSASVLTADFVFGMILDISSRYNNPEVARELSSAAIRMCEGEFREFKIDTNNYRIGWEEYVSIISQKTASLFQTAAKIGAILGGGNKEEINAFSNYGLHLGIAYQIQDDVLDWNDDGKITKALEINSSYGDIPTYLKKMAGRYGEKAKKDIDLLKESSTKNYLLELADFTVSRPI